jgi:hypothetical protein
MATQEELLHSALNEMKQATIRPEEWCRRIHEGYGTNPDGSPKVYNYKVTHNWHAANFLWEARNAQPANPNPTPSNFILGARCMYFAEVDENSIVKLAAMGMRHPYLYTALFSADRNLGVPGESYYPSDAEVQLLKDSHVWVGSWCDCSATPYSFAKQMKMTRQFNFSTGQFESNGEWDVVADEALMGTMDFAIGNPNNLSQDRIDAARHLVDTHEIALIGEVLQVDPGYSARGINISSECFYVGRDEGQGGYNALSNFIPMKPETRPTCSIYHGIKMRDPDWTLWEQWTSGVS